MRRLYVQDDFGVMQLLTKEQAAHAFADFWEDHGVTRRLPSSPRQDEHTPCPQCGCPTRPVL